MIFRLMQSALAATLVLVASLAFAGEPVDKALAEKLSKKLALPAMGLIVESVTTSQLPGLYEVQYANGGPLVYATAEGTLTLLVGIKLIFSGWTMIALGGAGRALTRD